MRFGTRPQRAVRRDSRLVVTDERDSEYLNKTVSTLINQSAFSM
jgi:hypothetical protein